MSRITWLGHATTVIDVDGVRLLTDPLLRNRVTHLRRAWPADKAALRGVDAVLVSHLHYDHLDLPSLSSLGSSMPLVLPRGAAPIVRRRGFASVTEMVPGDSIAIGSVVVRAVRAEHERERLPFGRTAQPMGFVVEGTHSVYFAGDTDLFDEMAGLHPDLDVALIPIWGWGPSLGSGKHLDPERAVEAVRRLRPRIVVPIHYGTYYPVTSGIKPPAYLSRVLDEFETAAEKVPGVDVRVLGPNGTTEID